MGLGSNKTKLYLEIVDKIQKMIVRDGLLPGDKLPSERELSERLQVGRSSVREALRALELLGLIETRRGEGTFLRDVRNHQLVEILGGFILQDEHIKKDLLETKQLIEKDAIRLIQAKKSTDSLIEFQEKLQNESIHYKDIFYFYLVKLTDNELLMKIWLIVKDYVSKSAYTQKIENKEPYIKLLKLLEKGHTEKALEVYDILQRS